MNSLFDLNINNYSITELESIFDLDENYDNAQLEQQKEKLTKNVLNNTTIHTTIKNNTVQFIEECKNVLKNKLETQIPTLLDSFRHIYNVDKTLHSSDIVNAGATNIIQHPDTPYGQSFPSEFYQGIINPLAKRILRKNINIDTRFRDNYYATQSTNFQVELPIRLTDVLSLQLSSIELPNSIYVISKIYGNNFFMIEYNVNENEKEIFPIIIPDGNYSFLSLQNYLNTFVENNAPPLFQDICFLIDINTGGSIGGSGKMIVGTKEGQVTKMFSLNFATDIYGNPDKQTPLALKFGWLIGFREGYYENNTNYVSEGMVDLNGSRYIYLVVDDFNNSVNDGFYGAFSSSFLNKNILARITLQNTNTNYSILSQNNLALITNPRQYFGPVNIQNIKIQLLDEYGRILNLNNMDFSFCLTFQTVYNL